jgi:hypothetical protein
MKKKPEDDLWHYLRDGRFWFAVLIVNLVSAPFVGIGRGIAQAVFG